MKTAIIVGASSQDGTLLTSFLLSRKYKVIGLTSSPSHSSHLFTTYTDLKSFSSQYKNLLRAHTPAYIFHFASHNKPASLTCDYSYNTLLTSNIGLTDIILQCTLSVSPSSHLVLCGSSQQYTTSGPLIVRASDPQQPCNNYAWTKACNQVYANYYRSLGLSITFAILFNHDSWARKPNFLLPSIASKIIEYQNTAPNSRSIPIYLRSPDAVFDISSAHDIVYVLYLLASHRANIDTTVGSGKATSVLEILEAFSYIVKAPINPSQMPSTANNKQPKPANESCPLAANEYQASISLPNQRHLKDICREVYYSTLYKHQSHTQNKIHN